MLTFKIIILSEILGAKQVLFLMRKMSSEAKYAKQMIWRREKVVKPSFLQHICSEASICQGLFWCWI